MARVRLSRSRNLKEAVILIQCPPGPILPPGRCGACRFGIYPHGVYERFVVGEVPDPGSYPGTEIPCGLIAGISGMLWRPLPKRTPDYPNLRYSRRKIGSSCRSSITQPVATPTPGRVHPVLSPAPYPALRVRIRYIRLDILPRIQTTPLPLKFRYPPLGGTFSHPIHPPDHNVDIQYTLLIM